MTVQDADDDSAPQEVKAALLEETATVSTREVVSGRVRVSTAVERFEEIARASLHGDRVEVTRVPIDRPVDQLPEVRTEGDLTVIPIFEEILVVEKRLILKEELHIRRLSVTETVEQPVSLRRQRAVVEREGESGTWTADVSSR